jgi:hypothetical protein
MEYARFTDGTTTIIVTDQDEQEYASWPFAIKIKIGSKKFKQVNARMSLGLAIEEAVEKFRNKTHMRWGN